MNLNRVYTIHKLLVQWVGVAKIMISYNNEIWDFHGNEYWISTLEDGGSKILRNVGILPHHYAASQPRRKPRLELSCGNLARTEQAVYSYSGGYGFESGQDHRLSSLRVFVIFLSLRRRMPESHLEIGYDRLLTDPYLFVHHNAGRNRNESFTIVADLKFWVKTVK